MDVRTFLSAVLAWTGGHVVISHHLEGEDFISRSCKTIDDALRLVEEFKLFKRNIYFCLSQQRLNSGLRNRANAMAFMALWMDIDIDPNNPKKFATLGEALAELLLFCDNHKIPRPSAIVATGGGLHAYWFSDRALTIEEWQPYADALKTTALNAGFKFDRSCTADAARVLRVPGTLNYKYNPPPLVRILKYGTGVKHDFTVAFASLAGTQPKPLKASIPKGLADRPMPTELGSGIETREVGPQPLEPILKECPWLREAYETGGEKFDQPQWNLTTLVATFLEDGDELAHKFGNRHPKYSHKTTDGLWNRKLRERRDKGLGWPSCRAIQDAGSVHCAGCPHLASGKSPLHLGFDTADEDDADDTANDTDGATAATSFLFNDESLDPEIAELGGIRPPEAFLPEGYAYDRKGRICAFIPAQKKKPAKLLPLLKTAVRTPVLQVQRGKFGMGLIAATDMGNEQEVFLPTDNIFPTLGLFKTLAEQFILFENTKESMDKLGLFAPAWLDRIRVTQSAYRDTGTMGWRYEEGKRIGFVFGSTFFHENGSEVQITGSADDEFRSWYTAVGDRKKWLAAAELLTDRKRPELELIIAIAFAAPLMTFSGTLYGAILSIWGNPGTSKSTAQQVAAAVWGHPKQTRESLNSTPKSVQGRLGRTRNLAAFWDDIQDEKHQEALFQTMFVATEGAEGGRLNPDSTYKARLEWQTLLAACSNASFVEFLIKKQKSTTAGMRRVFEVEYNSQPNEPGLINPIAANLAFAELEHNYGCIGAEYARILAVEHKDIADLVTEITKKFTAKVGGTSDEAYWWGMCGVLLAGATLARRLGVDFNVPAMEEFLEKMFLKNRAVRSGSGTEGGTTGNTDEGLSGFLNQFLLGNSIYTDRTFNSRHDIVEVWRKPEMGRPILLQVVRDESKIIISRKALREYLQKNGMQVRQVIDGVIKLYNARELKLTLGAGTPQAQAQEAVIQIHAGPEHPMLNDIITAFGQPAKS